jgi:hypothetical protein
MKTLIVTHIPKTAGTTLRLFLWHQFSQDSIYHVGDDISGDRVRLREMPVADKQSIRLVFGHICYGWHEFLPQPCEYTTLLRHPIDRLKSLYKFIRRDRTHRFHTYCLTHTFMEYVTSGITCETDNGMVRQLCGLDRWQKDSDNDLTTPFGQVGVRHVNAAISNMFRFPVVGVTDNLDFYFTELCHLYGWTYEEPQRANAAPPMQDRLDLSVDLDRIQPYIKHDMHLYKMAQRGLL